MSHAELGFRTSADPAELGSPSFRSPLLDEDSQALLGNVPMVGQQIVHNPESHFRDCRAAEHLAYQEKVKSKFSNDPCCLIDTGRWYDSLDHIIR